MNQTEQVIAYQRYLYHAGQASIRHPLTYGQWLAKQQARLEPKHAST